MILSPLRPPLVRPLTHSSPALWSHSSTDTDFGLPVSSCLLYTPCPAPICAFCASQQPHGFSQSFPDPTSPFYAPHSIITTVPFSPSLYCYNFPNKHATQLQHLSWLVCVCVCAYVGYVCVCVYMHVCVLMLCRPDASLNHFSTSFLQSIFLLLLLIIIIIRLGCVCV